jgi:hypothetical protein
MRLFWILALLLNASLASGAYASVLAAESTDLHEHYQFTTFVAQIKVRNTSDEVVRLLRVEALRPNDRVIESPKEIAGTESTTIAVQISTDDDVGYALHGVRITTDNEETQLLQLRNFGLTLLSDARPQADLGVLNEGTPAKAVAVTLNGSLDSDLRILRVEQVPDFVTASVKGASTIEIIPNPRATWGFHQGFIRVALNSTLQPAAVIRVLLDVHGEIIPSENPFAMGILRIGSQSPHLVTLRSKSGKGFDIDAITFRGFQATAREEQCQPKALGCRNLDVQAVQSQPTGRLSGEMQVRFKGRSETLAIALSGVLIAQDTKIIPLQITSDQGASTGNDTSKTDLKSALDAVTRNNPNSSPSIPAGTGPLLKWKVENDWQLHGYLVFRGETENGPFNPVTSEAILSEGPMQGGAVTRYWRDTEAVAERTYWYYVVSIGMDGRLQQLSGPQKAVAK